MKERNSIPAEEEHQVFFGDTKVNHTYTTSDTNFLVLKSLVFILSNAGKTWESVG